MTIMAATSRLARASTCLLGLCLAACTAPAVNSTLNSVHQPVIERTSDVMDLATLGGEIPGSEQRRLAAWFASLGLEYGDRVALAGADDRAREVVATLAEHHGAAIDQAGGPASDLGPNQVRVLVSRSHAFVPGCLQWSDRSAANLENSTSPSYGCAVNGNLAAMVADPEHLLRGAEGTGETLVMSASKAIESYRALEPTGAAGLSDVSSRGGEE